MAGYYEMRYSAARMAEVGEPPAPEERAPLPRPRDLVAALRLLTVLPGKGPDHRSEAFARAALFFPVAGLLIGVLLASLRGLIGRRFPGWVLSVALLAVWETLSGVGLLRLQWGRWGIGRNRASLTAAATTLISLLAKLVCMAQPGGSRLAALLFAPMLARWSMVVLAVGARDAGTPGRKFNAAITFREFAWTSVFTFTVVFAIAEAFGIVIVVGTAALTLAVRLLAHRWMAGISWRLLLVAGQGIEAFVIVLFTLL
jgi:cobalamin synthase